MALKESMTGLWLPREIFDDMNLSWTEKVLLSQISALDNDVGKGCYASASHFAEILNLKEGTVRNMLSDLRSRGYLEDLWSNGHSRGLRVAIFNARNRNSAAGDRNEIVTGNRNENMTEASQINDATVTRSLREPSQKNDKNNKENGIRKNQAREVFLFWITTFEKGSATIFGPKREKAVLKRLDDGYTVDQLKDAVRGCKESPYHQGQNPGEVVYDDLELICRDETKVDYFISIWNSSDQAATASKELPERCNECRHNGGLIYNDDGEIRKCPHGSENRSESLNEVAG